NASFHRRDRRLWYLATGVVAESLGHRLLRPPPPLPDRLHVVRDDRVDVERVGRSRPWRRLGFCPLACSDHVAPLLRVVLDNHSTWRDHRTLLYDKQRC